MEGKRNRKKVIIGVGKGLRKKERRN